MDDQEEPEIEVRVRRAVPEDAPHIRDVLTAAFETESEANIVDGLMADGDAEFILIAEAAGHHIGNVTFSRLTVSGTDQPIRALALAPVAVHPELQGLGIGSGLIEGGLALAGKDKWDLVLVLGEPDYYSRFGFSVEAAAGIECPYSGPYLAAWTFPGVELPDGLVVRYPDAFHSLN